MAAQKTTITKDDIHDSWRVDWIQESLEIVKACDFRNNQMPWFSEGKVAVGKLLFVKFPQKDKSPMGGMRFQIVQTTDNPQRKRILGTRHYAMMLVFADLHNLPNCFAVIHNERKDFKASFRNNPNVEDITIGDVIAFAEPSSHDEMLGNNMTVIRDATNIAVCVRNNNWPVHEVMKSDSDEKQIAFHAPGKKLRCCKAEMLLDQKIKCDSKTCDRQNVNCPGCFGRSDTTRPLVMECAVVIFDCPRYEKKGYATFEHFRSLQFTKIFFANMWDYSTADRHRIHSDVLSIRTAVNAMVEHVNDNGGWTVTGWHRNGKITENNGEQTQSVCTRGHIVSIQPTNSAAITSQAFRDNLIQAVQPMTHNPGDAQVNAAQLNQQHPPPAAAAAVAEVAALPNHHGDVPDDQQQQLQDSAPQQTQKKQKTAHAQSPAGPKTTGEDQE